MEIKSTILDPKSNFNKKRKYSDTEDSELIKENPKVMSENAETLTRITEKSLASKTDSSSDGKDTDQLDENKSQTDSSEFSGTEVPHVPKYIYGPRPPSKPGLFDCNKCSKNFKSLHVLNTHNTFQHVEKKFDPEKPFMCDICDQSFYNFPSLSGHRNSKHKIPNPLHESNQLTIGMIQPEQTNSSLSVQTNGSFSCSKCPKTFPREKGLLSHYRDIHIERCDNPDPFICDICGKAFQLGRALGSHRSAVHGSWHKKQRSF